MTEVWCSAVKCKYNYKGKCTKQVLRLEYGDCRDFELGEG